MEKSYLEDVFEKIQEATTLVLVLVVAEGCFHHKSYIENDIQEKLKELNLFVPMYTVCYDDDNLPWPYPATQTLYYFAPKGKRPLFYRMGRDTAANMYRDFDIAQKMIDGASYEDASMSKEEKESHDTVAALLEEEEKAPKDKYPSKFQMVRNLGKEMWKSAKNASRGLPVLVDADTAFDRYSTCRGCEHFTKDMRCTQCGCFMNSKVNLASASCPLKKWKGDK